MRKKWAWLVVLAIPALVLALGSGKFTMTGKIGNRPVQMELNVEGSKVTGTMVNTKNNRSFRLEGTVDGSGQAKVRVLDADGKKTGVLIGVIKAGKFSGNFKDEGKDIPFEVSVAGNPKPAPPATSPAAPPKNPPPPAAPAIPPWQKLAFQSTPKDFKAYYRRNDSNCNSAGCARYNDSGACAEYELTPSEGGYSDGVAVDLNQDGSVEYIFSCFQPAHGPSDGVVFTKVGGKWNEISAFVMYTEFPEGFSVLAEVDNGYHRIRYLEDTYKFDGKNYVGL